MDRLHWKKGDRLQIRKHTSKPKKGLTYQNQYTVAIEDGFDGGWDVWDGENNFSFYGFSVERIIPNPVEGCRGTPWCHGQTPTEHVPACPLFARGAVARGD